VTYGGADLGNDTVKAVQALRLLEPQGLQVDVVVGSGYQQLDGLRDQCAQGMIVHVDASNMAILMARADLAISAGGSSTWERCCVGLPALVTAISDNQVEVSEHLGRLGAQVFLGETRSVTPGLIAEHLERLLDNPDLMAGMSKRCFGIVDGLGAARVAARLDCQEEN
jgi:UDP-2,4-diacetamido-2,4,6-trideoxy-beta-L-altropyranose hydrolase